MGQYHVAVNLDKHEYLHAHQLGDGLKLMEFGNSAGGVMTGLALLLAVSNGRGGGDFHGDDPNSLVGSWGGDRIAIVGDYAEPSDLPEADHAETIYHRCYDDGDYADITRQVRSLIEADGLYLFSNGDGWIERKQR